MWWLKRWSKWSDLFHQGRSLILLWLKRLMPPVAFCSVVPTPSLRASRTTIPSISSGSGASMLKGSGMIKKLIFYSSPNLDCYPKIWIIKERLNRVHSNIILEYLCLNIEKMNMNVNIEFFNNKIKKVWACVQEMLGIMLCVLYIYVFVWKYEEECWGNLTSQWIIHRVNVEQSC